jgi:hypothetical protein
MPGLDTAATLPRPAAGETPGNILSATMVTPCPHRRPRCPERQPKDLVSDERTEPIELPTPSQAGRGHRIGHHLFHGEAVDIEVAGPAGFVTPDAPAQRVPATPARHSLTTGLHSFPCNHLDCQPSRDEAGIAAPEKCEAE